LKENAQPTQDLLGTLQSEMEELAQTLATELQAKAEFERTVGELSGQIKGAQLELAKHESQLANLQETQERLVQSQQQRTRQREQLDHRLLELRDAMRKSDHEILTAQSHISEAALELDQLIGQSRSIVTERDSLRQQRREFSREEDGLQKRLRKQEDRHRHLEFEIQKSRHQLTTMGDRIQEEYQLSLEDLLESNLSAYQQYLAEHYAPIEEDAPEIENLEESVAGEESEDGPGADSVEDSSEQILEEAGDTEVASEELDGEDQDIEDSVPEVDSPEDGGLTKDRKVDVPSFEEVRDELEADVDRLRRKIKAIGNVNTDALDSLDELETRYATLSSQLEDLQMAKSALEDIIRRINHESERIFITTFETIRGHFQELFRKLFGGGNADIVLEDPENVLDCGIDIVARPPGKELRSISLLSGGEKTMTAVAMLFAMFKSKPSPYCVLDEVDAALDDANVDRYVTVIKEFVSMTQFIVITHRKRTMTAADVLYGVTMEQAGVSKRISVSFDDVSDNGEIRNAA
ncbi:MAG: chromosome segregation protein SMC, partial [Planctomycetaceae bacterium]|nr:chromosome segregation protein SMC [Planctomycetaceae bacterium]